MTNYLITGSSGFVGRHLCTQLQAPNDSINTIGRGDDSVPGVDQHWQGDLLAHKLPAELMMGVEVVIHLAGLAHQSAMHKDDPQPYFDLNRDATLTLAKAAGAAGVKKFLFVSSVKAAGYDRQREPNDETTATVPDDAYGLSKWQAEEALLDLPFVGMDTIIVRPSLVYGAGVKGNLRSMMRAIKNGWFPSISGGGVRSMVSVNDLCAALINLSQAEDAAKETFIVTDGERYTVERIGTAIRAALGKRGNGLRIRSHDLHRVAALSQTIERRVGVGLPINKALVNKLCGSEWYSAERLQQTIGWRPKQTLEDQLPAMVRHMAAHHE
ncbi:MAG: NAD-dependent epimerase/dehydratase family protein [Pseudomonadales bacterium]